MNHRNDDSWDAMFQYLVDFKERYGHTDIRQAGEDMELGAWLSNQRIACRTNKMETDRESRLRKLAGASFEYEYEGRRKAALEDPT